VENYDIKDISGNKIKVDFNVSIISNSLENISDFTSSFSGSEMTISNITGLELLQNYKLIFYFFHIGCKQRANSMEQYVFLYTSTNLWQL
jgi:hypothetical protein